MSDRASGKIVWLEKRPEKANYASPIVLHYANRDQLLVQGCDLASSFEPATGKKLWEVEGTTTECVTTMVTDGQRVFASGGYPRKHVQAIEADGSGKTAWASSGRGLCSLDGRPPRPSVCGPRTAASPPAGNATPARKCGKQRLGGTFTASLVLLGENLFATNEAGQTFIFKANPTKYELVAENQLGEEVYSTPAICGSRIYHRVALRTGDRRQELLYCLGTKK